MSKSVRCDVSRRLYVDLDIYVGVEVVMVLDV